MQITDEEPQGGRDAASLSTSSREEASFRGLDYERIEAILRERWKERRKRDSGGGGSGGKRGSGSRREGRSKKAGVKASPDPDRQVAVLRAIEGILTGRMESLPQDDLREGFAVLRRDLEFRLPHDILPSTPRRVGSVLKNLFAAVFFAFCLYIIIGGMLERESAIVLGGNPAVNIAVLVAVILLLAVVEGLEIAATAILLKNLDRVTGRFPRTHEIHTILTEGSNMSSFLAGRQVFVILLVFIAAQLTTFPRMERWPFTGAAFPAFMMPWFKIVFLELGLLGAFFVVWFGQLAPKLVASKSPLEFLQFPPMKPIVKLTLVVEALGLTSVSSWISGMAGPGEKNIMIAPAERYRANVDLLGVATRGRYIDIVFEKDTVTIKDARALVTQRDIKRFFDRFQMNMWGIRTFRYSIRASTGGRAREGAKEGDAGREIILSGTEDYARLDEEKQTTRVFPAVLELDRTGFREGEPFRISREFTGFGTSPHRFRNFRIDMDTPPQVLDVSITFRGFEPESAFVSTFPLEEILDVPGSSRQALDIDRGRGGERTVRYTSWYPGVGTIHEIGWNMGGGDRADDAAEGTGTMGEFNRDAQID